MTDTQHSQWTKLHKIAGGIFAVTVGLFALGACSGDDPGQAEPTPQSVTKTVETEEPTTEPSPTKTDEETDAMVQELALQMAWDTASEEDQVGICLLYGADPDLAVDAFMEGAGEDTVDRDRVDAFFNSECGG